MKTLRFAKELTKRTLKAAQRGIKTTIEAIIGLAIGGSIICGVLWLLGWIVILCGMPTEHMNEPYKENPEFFVGFTVFVVCAALAGIVCAVYAIVKGLANFVKDAWNNS